MPFRKSRPLRLTPEKPSVDWGDPINKGLLAYYPMAEAGGRTFFDAVNPAQNATLNSGNRVGGGSPLGRNTVFSGSQAAPSALVKAPSGTSYTFGGWMNCGAISSQAFIGTVGAGGARQNIILGVQTNTQIVASQYFDDLLFTVPSVTGRRIFVYVTLDQNLTQTLYYQGRAVASQTAGGFATLVKSMAIGGANYFAGAYMLGGLDNIRLYNRALRPAEIQRLYSTPLAGVVAPWRRIISDPGVAGSVALAPGTGALAFTGYAPAVSATGSVALAPGTGALAFTGYAPAVSNGAAPVGIGRRVAVSPAVRLVVVSPET